MSAYTTVVSGSCFGEEWTYEAHHQEMPGCIGAGGSPDEAIESLDRMTPGYLDFLRRHGVPIPKPATDSPHVKRIVVSGGGETRATGRMEGATE